MGDVAEVVGGGTPSTSDDGNFAEAGIPWLTPADLTGYRDVYISRGRRDLSDRGYKASAARIMPRGTVLFSSRAPIGYCAIAAGEISTNQGFKSFVLKGELSPEYVRHYLLGSVDYAESKASGTTFKELSGSRAAELVVPVPPLPEQRRIVAKIDSLTGKSRRARDHLDHIPRLVEKYKQAVLAAAFRGDLTREWRAQNVFGANVGTLLNQVRAARDAVRQQRGLRTKGRNRSVPTKIVDLVELPAGWAWGTFDDCSWDMTVGHVGPMKDRYVESGVTFLRSLNVRRNRVDLAKVVYIDETFNNELAKSQLHPGDLVVVRTGEPGVAAVIPPELGTANCSDLVIARLVEIVNPHFAAYYMNSDYAQAVVSGFQVGVAQQHFNVGAMSEMPVPFAPTDEQAEIARRIETAFAKIDRLASEATSARRLIDRLDQSVLARAFRGELVPQDPADEPANVLLERIRAERGAAPKAKRGRKAKAA